MSDKITYIQNGKQYQKLERDEIIKPGAMQSLYAGDLFPIMHQETIGQTPADFSDKRDFYNPIEGA